LHCNRFADHHLYPKRNKNLDELGVVGRSNTRQALTVSNLSESLYSGRSSRGKNKKTPGISRGFFMQYAFNY
jgi:hypothetical protein